MKKFLLCALLALGLNVPNIDAKDSSDAQMEYELQGAGTGVQGTYLVEVSVLSKSNKVSDADLINAAVHGVLFRGFVNPETRNSQKPLAGSAANEDQHIDFYKDFFSANGKAHTFGSVARGSRAITKAGKQWKVSAKVTVNKNSLLQYLEQQGVVESLNSIF